MLSAKEFKRSLTDINFAWGGSGSGAHMPFRHLLDGGVFSAQRMTAMEQAYEAVRQKLHDRGQPAVVNEVVARRIIELAKREALTAHQLAERALASFGLAGER